MQKLLFILFFFIACAYAEPVVVTIDTIVKKIDESNSCQWFKQHNTADNACLCCIVKNSVELKKGKTPQEIFEKCITLGLCTEAGIDYFITQQLGDKYSYAYFQSNKDQAAEDILKQSLLSLADKSLVIKDIATDAIALNKEGHFTPESLSQFLSKAFAEGKLPDQAFKETTCLQSKGLFEEKGLNTLQLFVVNSTCTGKKQSYIVKEIGTKEEEVANLAKATNIPGIQDIVYPNTEPGLPIIYLPIAYFSYQYNGVRHVLSLMHMAEGKPLGQFMKDYKANPNEENAKKAAFAFEKVGEALSHFQKRFIPLNAHFAPTMMRNGFLHANQVPTLLHGDFHHGNVFVSDTGTVSFIDNERMSRFFNNNKDITNDIVYIFYVSLGSLVTPLSFYQGFNTMAWVELSLKSFIEGYLKPYDENQKIDVLKGLNDRFVHTNKYIDHSIYGDFGNEYFALKSAVDKVFEDLYKKYNVPGQPIK